MLVSAACLITHSNSRATAPGGAAMYSPVLPPFSGHLCTHTIDPLINKTPHFIPQKRKQPSGVLPLVIHSSNTWLRFHYMTYKAQEGPCDYCCGRKAHHSISQWGKQPCRDCPLQMLHPQMVQPPSHALLPAARTTSSLFPNSS